MCLILSVCDCVLSVQTLEGCEILLGPEVTYGPPGLDLFCPVAMTIAHCAEVDTENWNIQLKRKTQDSKWEVRAAGAQTHTPVKYNTARQDLRRAQTWRSALRGCLFPQWLYRFCFGAKCQQE